MNISQAVALAFKQVDQGAGGHQPEHLLGQMLDIARNTEEGRAGRPGDALGVSAKTWNNWLMNARGVGGNAPSPASDARIRAAVRNIHRAPDAPVPRRARITADVEWNGYYNPGKHRTVHLDDLFLDDAYAAFDNDVDAAPLFLAALAERYGVPVGLTKVDSIEFY